VVTTQTGVEYSLDGTTYQSTNTFAGLTPNSYTLYVRNLADATCVTTSSSATVINAVPLPPAVPTASSTVQPTCATPSGTITIATQSGVEYSVNGTTYQSSNSFAGLAAGDYTLYVRNLADASCVTLSGSTTTINATPPPPVVPTTATVTQPTCAVPSGSISVTTQSGVEYSLDGTTYQASNTFSGLAPDDYTLYAQSTSDNTCVTLSSSVITINAVPLPPAVPTTSSTTQPTCGTPSGTIVVTTQTGVEYSLDGTTYQSTNTFAGLTPNSYTLYVRNLADATCVTTSSSATVINAVPLPPAVPTASNTAQPTCATPSGTITIATQSGVEYSVNGTTYQSSNSFAGLTAGSYTLYVRKLADVTCVTSSVIPVTINVLPVVLVPTAASITQPTCAVPLGTIVIATQAGLEYSLNGTTYQTSNTFSSLIPNNYTLYVRNIVDPSCMAMSSSATKINAVPLPPAVPTVASWTQPSCATPSGTISIATQSGVEYSLNGTTFQSSNTFSGLAPNNYVLYVRNIVDNSCVTQSLSSAKIDPLPALPAVPMLASLVQPTCAVQTGTIRITAQNNVQYSIGAGYQDSSEFKNLSPGDYTLSVRFTTSIACITVGSKITVNPIPAQIQFESVGDCVSKEYVITASPLASSYNPNNVDYQWKDNLGNPVGTNSNTLNVSDIVSSSISEVAFPLNYTLTISSTATGCETTENILIESVYCNIQKGISPDGNGSNDYFDLRLMDVKKLSIFDRYGIKVYSQVNYTDQWKGQSDNGNELPSATYYYVMELNNATAKTGWIYLIREK
jgi:gliding motility-associated-like protein